MVRMKISFNCDDVREEKDYEHESRKSKESVPVFQRLNNKNTLFTPRDGDGDGDGKATYVEMMQTIARRNELN